MSTTQSSPASPVTIARLALLKLAEAALPPTPENYASEYRRAAGSPEGDPDRRHAEAHVPENAGTLLLLTDTIVRTATDLSAGVDRFDGDYRTMLDGFDPIGRDALPGFLDALAQSRRNLEETIKSSRRELDATRKRLKEVSAELERSRTQARIDPLTGFANRRGMHEFIGREIARARRGCKPFSIGIIDIDHFKRVNDEHGHDVGDRALIHLATVVRARLRESDIVCRYGGEEFVVILPETAVNGAMLAVEQLRALMESTPLPIASGGLQICFSAGVAEFDAAENRETLLKRADEALYAAKRGGRNRVIAAGPAGVA